MTHICVSQLITIVSDNGLSPDRRQAIIWNNDGILFFGPVGRIFSEILIEIYTFSFKKMHLKISSGKWRPSCLLGRNVLRVFAVPFCTAPQCLERAATSWIGIHMLDWAVLPCLVTNRCVTTRIWEAIPYFHRINHKASSICGDDLNQHWGDGEFNITT